MLRNESRSCDEIVTSWAGSKICNSLVALRAWRFGYWTDRSGRDYVWLSKGISLLIKASTSSRPSATSAVSISFS